MPVNMNERMAALERYALVSSKKINLLLWKQLQMENAITISKKQKIDLEQQFHKLQETNCELKDKIVKNESVIMDLTVRTRKMVDIEHLMKSLLEKTKDVDEIKSDIERLSQESKVIPAIQSEIERLSTKTEEVENMQYDVSRLTEESKKMPAIITEIQGLAKKTQEVDEIKSDIKRLSQETKVIPAIQSEIERLSTKTEEVENMQYDVSRLTEESKKMPAIITEIQGLAKKTQVDDLEKRTDQLEVRKENIKQSVTCVALKKQENLTKGTYMKLDVCHYVDINSGMFDEDSCSFIPQCKGVYGIMSYTLQKGDGSIKMRLNWEEDTCGYTVGKTVKNGDECSGGTCVYLDKGQKMWMEATRIEGVAEVLFCRLVCWLLD